MNEPLLKVENLKKYFPVKGGFFKRTVGYIKAVDGVSFSLNEGETYGLVGESGCGKSTTGRTILRLYEKTDGNVFFENQDIGKLSKKELNKIRPQMQMVFQDPYSSLEPRMTIGNIIGEALVEHNICSKKEKADMVLDVMKSCGLPDYYYNRFAHEFSGGQRQRVGIARAIAMHPKFIVCDEPVSALDVSIQAQIINLLCELQEKYKISYLFISHDLSIVRYISHKIGVMYLGELIETAPKDELYTNPVHPYTKALLSAVPVPDINYKRNRIILKGDMPSPANPPKGCKFHERCAQCKEICKNEVPPVVDIGGNHMVKCHFAK